MARVSVSVPDQTPHVVYDVGGTAQSVFAFNYPWWTEDDIVVRIAAKPSGAFVPTAAFSIAPTGGVSSTGYPGATITLNSAVTDSLVMIRRERKFDRISQFPAGVALDVFTLNRDVNRVVGLLQSLRMEGRQSLRVALSSELPGEGDLEIPVHRDGQLLSFDDQGRVITVPLAYRLEATPVPVSTIIEMQALLEPGHGDAVLVTEEGRGGVFEFDAGAVSASDDGLTFKADDATPGSWVRRFPEVINPRWFGAAGDGVTNDAGNYAVAESAGTLISLDQFANYNLGTTKPTVLVQGPGAVTVEGSAAVATVGGFFVGFDAMGGSIVAQPPVWAEEANGLASSPGGISNYFNVILAPGSNAANIETDKNVWRSVVIGEAAGQRLKKMERSEAIGSGAMRFAQLVERTTALGTLAFSWLGAESQQYLRDTFHDFWLGADKPGDPGWNFLGLEGQNPGIGAALDAYSAYPTVTTTQTQNVALGRDAGLHMVKGRENTFVGYQAGTNVFDGSENTAVGNRALRDGVFAQNMTALGRSAGIHCQEGSGSLFVGRQAGINHIKGLSNIFIGPNAGADLTLAGGKEWSNVFCMGTTPRTDWLTGNISTGAFCMNIPSLDIVTTLGSGFYNGGTIPGTPARFNGTVTSVTAMCASIAAGTVNRVHHAFENSNGVVGTISTSGTATAYNTSSDYRLKDKGEPISDALARVEAVPAWRFSWKEDPDGVLVDGFMAHEIQAVVPEAVTGEKDAVEVIGEIRDEHGAVLYRNCCDPGDELEDGQTWEATEERPAYQQIDQSKLVPLLWAAVQELSAKVKALEASRSAA